MKIPIMLCAAVILCGCTHEAPKPITIRLVATDAVEVDALRYTHRELRNLLLARSARHGMSLIALVAEPQTTYASIQAVRDVAMSCGYWKFLLSVGDAGNSEEFYGPSGDETPGVSIEVDMLNGRITRDRMGVEPPLADILTNATNVSFRVAILADRTTTAEKLFQVLRIGNASGHTVPVIVNRPD